MSIGQPTRRVEGPLKVTGAAKYAADHYPAASLHAAIVGSPVAAGRVTAIDTMRAAALGLQQACPGHRLRRARRAERASRDLRLDR